DPKLPDFAKVTRQWRGEQLDPNTYTDTLFYYFDLERQDKLIKKARAGAEAMQFKKQGDVFKQALAGVKTPTFDVKQASILGEQLFATGVPQQVSAPNPGHFKSNPGIDHPEQYVDPLESFRAVDICPIAEIGVARSRPETARGSE